MNLEMINYIRQLHYFVEGQQRKILALETAVNSLKDEVNTLKNRPPIHVDSIRYSFDQLKVETLEGTLNIGLNPSDLQGMDEFSVNQQNIPPFMPPERQAKAVMNIEDELYRYLDNEVPQIFKRIKEQEDLTIDESYLDFIKTDIKKQLPQRIEGYLAKFLHENRSPEAQANINENIINLLKKDIDNGVEVFLRNFKTVERNE